MSSNLLVQNNLTLFLADCFDCRDYLPVGYKVV